MKITKPRFNLYNSRWENKQWTQPFRGLRNCLFFSLLYSSGTLHVLEEVTKTNRVRAIPDIFLVLMMTTRETISSLYYPRTKRLRLVTLNEWKNVSRIKNDTRFKPRSMSFWRSNNLMTSITETNVYRKGLFNSFCPVERLKRSLIYTRICAWVG